MTKLRVAIAGLLLAAVMALAPATPASAHATSNEAAWTCAATMPSGFGTPPDDVVMHAHLVGVGFGFRRYACESWNFVSGSGSNGCQWFAWYVDGTGPFGPESGWVCY